MDCFCKLNRQQSRELWQIDLFLLLLTQDLMIWNPIYDTIWQVCAYLRDIIQLTINSERNLLLSCTYTGDHSTAHVFPSILLSHRLQCQEVLIAKNLQQKNRSKIIWCNDSKSTFTFEIATRPTVEEKKERQLRDNFITLRAAFLNY